MTDQFSHGYALLIGVDQNSVLDWALPAVARDVEALRAVLVHPQRCAYNEAQVKLISGAAATRNNILAGFDWLQACLAGDPAATAVVYYSGHGWRDEETQPSQYYFIPYDVRRDRLRSSALRAAELAEAIDALHPQRLLVLLDCCHAGGMAVKDLATRYRAAAPPLDLFVPPGAPLAKTLDSDGPAPLHAGEGRAVLTSSRAEQRSYISSKAQMSIFTYHLLAALTGSAQPREGAQEVLVSDLLGYVYRHVPTTARQEIGAEQQPDGRLTGNFAVALLLGGKGLAAGAPPPSPVEPLPAQSGSAQGGRNIQIGKIEAVNVGETQIIDQRGATIQVGGRTTSKYDCCY
ncbi:MAG: caspase family protein [Caldilinea sp. CFX5]|nr:caspase family protein [Caldilinea sp. CFX5]